MSKKRTIEDDAAKMLGVPPHDGMNPCAGDGYFGRDCVERWGEAQFQAACDRVLASHAKGMEAYKAATSNGPEHAWHNQSPTMKVLKWPPL